MSPEIYKEEEFDGHAVDIWAGMFSNMLLDIICFISGYTYLIYFLSHSWNNSIIPVEWQAIQ